MKLFSLEYGHNISILFKNAWLAKSAGGDAIATLYLTLYVYWCFIIVPVVLYYILPLQLCCFCL